jgi:hypothetical protein
LDARVEVELDERAFFAGLALFAVDRVPEAAFFAFEPALVFFAVLAGPAFALAADDAFGALPVDDLVVDDLAGAFAELAAVEALDRFGLSLPPIGRASPTALMAPDAASPTAPAILPACSPTLFTTLPGSGMTMSSCVRNGMRSRQPLQRACRAAIGGCGIGRRGRSR